MHNWRNWRREVCSWKVRWWRDLARRRRKDVMNTEPELVQIGLWSEPNVPCSRWAEGCWNVCTADAASVCVHRGFHNVHAAVSHSSRSLLGSSALEEVGSVKWRDVRSKVYTDSDLIVLFPHHGQNLNLAASPVGNTWKTLDHTLLNLWLNF